MRCVYAVKFVLCIIQPQSAKKCGNCRNLRVLYRKRSQEVILNNETKMFLGKVLGEVYKVQYNLDPDNCTVGPERIYGLIHGIENAVEAELPTDFIDKQEIRQVEEILHPYLYDGKLATSFLGLKIEAEKEMIDEGKLITILPI